jgi:hypothetical protein
LDDVARSSGESASEIARRARRALDLLLQIPTSKADETDGSNATPTEVECDVDTAHGDAAERRNAKSGVKRDATESNRGGRDTNEEARR